MFTLRTLDVTKEFHQAENGDVFVVYLQILNGDEVVEERKLAFPITTSSKELQNELKKFIKTYNLDAEQAIKNAEFEKVQKEADKTIEKVKGFEA